jgi:ribonuclease E
LEQAAPAAEVEGEERAASGPSVGAEMSTQEATVAVAPEPMAESGRSTAEAPRAEQQSVAQELELKQEVDAPQSTEEQHQSEEQPAATSGLTEDGRAVNDPRVEPRPVGEVTITTTHPVLFTDSVAPPLAASGRIAPRASNDPRGQLPEADICQVAQS